VGVVGVVGVVVGATWADERGGRHGWYLAICRVDAFPRSPVEMVKTASSLRPAAPSQAQLACTMRGG
jgi:hypothetical protein